MTVWFCDRCGEQVKKDSNGAGKYDISVHCLEQDDYFTLRPYVRGLKLCPDCAQHMETLIDQELSQMPKEVTVTFNRRS